MVVAPVWVRGLKLALILDAGHSQVAPVWVRGLKRLQETRNKHKTGRTRMGAWIETSTSRTSRLLTLSHPYGCVD